MGEGKAANRFHDYPTKIMYVNTQYMVIYLSEAVYQKFLTSGLVSVDCKTHFDWSRDRLFL
jgi:hypothetical protein